MIKKLSFLFLALLLAGCSTAVPPVSFYYPLEVYRYSESPSVISSESRSLGAHSQDLIYVIDLYLLGPAEENLRSPFPEDTRLEKLLLSEKSAEITLNEAAQDLSDIQFTLACSCLAKTCMQLMPLEEIAIESGSRTITISADDLVLQDETIAPSESDAQ